MLAIVVSTHNRAASLRRTLAAVVTQLPPDGSVQLIVVDNNSTDDTRHVCAAIGDRLTYVHEDRQGLSHARNRGITTASTSPDDLIAFTDDDVEPAAGWVATLRALADEHPEVDCFGGPVLPSNPDTFPRWLTKEHWGPLALQDHGGQRLVFDLRRPLGLVGANFAFRRRVFDRQGGFSPAVQRVKDGIGSTEDHEFLQRLYASGGRALYAPELLVHTAVQPDRLTLSYHRRWHRGHGKFYALMRLPEVETARLRILGVPLHLVRGAARDAAAWARSSLARDRAAAFAAETRLWFFSGFFQERLAWHGRR